MKTDWPCEFPGVNWLGKEEEKAVLDVVRKGSLFRYYGPEAPTHVAQLEGWARQYYGVEHALAVNSGTGALCTAMSALGIGPGCEVIVPAFLWVSTVTAIVQCNAIPVVCEIDDTFNLDAADLRRKITPRTKLIVVVHMAGAPCDMAAVMQVADEHRIPVLEDCAQCNGGSFRGCKVGTFGRVGIFSLQINKNATAGEGGLVVTGDDALYQRLVAAHDVGVPWEKNAPNETSDVQLWGQGRRMSELAGAVANVQLRRLPDIVAHMRASKQRIKDALGRLPGVSFRRLTDPDGDTGPFLILCLEDESRARAVLEVMKKDVRNVWCLREYGLHIYHNIGALVRKVPLSPAGNPWSLPQNAGSVREYGRGACPQSDALFARSILITIPSRLTRAQEKEMARAIRASIADATAPR
ncbi:MAG: DegT/DnrJ/EryC1/StrS family aminotransferase [Planctomycetes bacterium]|nr:DegT/DnrJ/EryC1/StrS family aminotransferase [Planctomycetota bacterium]